MSSSVEIAILAAGRSTRLGRDKRTLRLGGRTLLTRARALGAGTGLGVRVIRRDLVPACGPLGGIWTAFHECDAQRILFLSCDMPFVSPEWLRKVMGRRPGTETGRFSLLNGRVGFPFLLDRRCLALVGRQLEHGEFSLQRLARRMAIRKIAPSINREWELFNVNTPADWITARAIWRERFGRPAGRGVVSRPAST